MSFNEVRLDDKISFGATGGPSWQTDIAAVDSGFEYSNQNWAQARHRYEISYDARRPEIFDQLLAFYMAMGGRAGQFRYKDWADFSATSTQGVVSQLTSTTFQCYKRYLAGSLAHNRKIVKLTGTPVALGSGVSPVFDPNTGIITVSSGTVTGWYGDFDVPVRFDTDVMQAVIINRSKARGLIQGWQSISLVEVRL